ncbi:hypothetical protein [Enterococcus faecalis]|uniref:hypothetical protein n=1 Tax=Enterococcus faecalis TaxID=1351 RepID=UPI003D10A6FC
MKKSILLLFFLCVALFEVNFQTKEVQADESQLFQLTAKIDLKNKLSETVSNEQGVLKIERSKSLQTGVGMRDQIYDISYHGYDGCLNVYFQAIIADDMFIAVNTPWTTQRYLCISNESLSVDNPKQSSYSFSLTNVVGITWRQRLQASITCSGNLEVNMYRSSCIFGYGTYRFGC